MQRAASHLNLFGVEAPKRETRKTDPTPPGVIQKLIALYRQGYERKFHEPPVILKSDGPLLKGLVRQFGPVKVEQRLAAFLAWNDPFVVDSGYSLKIFHARWNALAAKCVQEMPERGPVRGVAETEAYLESIRAARRAAR